MTSSKFKPRQLIKYTYNGEERFLAIVIQVKNFADENIVEYLRIVELSRNNGFRMGGIGSADSRYLTIIS